MLQPKDAQRRQPIKYQWQRRALWESTGGTCGICGQPLRLAEMEPDHIVPWHQGGTSAWENLRPTHRLCNRSRPVKQCACIICGQRFDGYNRSRYCSQRCQKRAYRARKHDQTPPA